MIRSPQPSTPSDCPTRFDDPTISTEAAARPIVVVEALTVVDLFEQVAAAYPTAAAVEFGNRRLSYAELDAQSNGWARFLIERGVRPECLVGVCLERSCEMIIALLAVLKAGGAFLPLDPVCPQQRLQFMVQDAATQSVVTDSPRAEIFLADVAHVLCFDNDAAVAEAQPAAPIERRPRPEDLAYTIFTSGSTGRPKAALLAHRGLALMVQALPEPFGVSFGTRVLQFASLSFDAAICEIFVALTSGATLCLADQSQLTPGTTLVETLERLRIEQAILSPSVIALCPPRPLPLLRTLVVAGETCSSRVASQWSIGRRLVNAYGPTEATVCTTWHECSPGAQLAPPIGRFVPYCQGFVLDEQRRPVAVGTTGELYLAGPSLARGYLNRPELTEMRFPTIARPGHPHATENTNELIRVYRTGDLVRYNVDGELEFVARIDAQLKVRGVRIEPQEVRRLLEEHPAVAIAYVDCSEDAAGQPRLVAYAVAESNRSPLVPADRLQSELRETVRARLPIAMQPAEIIVIHQLPLTSSGKIDVAALRALRATQLAELTKAPASCAPQSVVERRLLALWESILTARTGQQNPLSIHDDFFAMGGDSLSALELLAQIENGFGRRVPLAELIQRPTVARLARLLETSSPPTQAEDWSPLVALQPHGSRLPLYLMSPGGGNVLCYQALVSEFDTDTPVYGLQARGFYGSEQPLTTVDGIAADYIAAIRQVQPHGPYALAGWSFGGVVAYEMACQMTAAGEQISVLALIDAGIAHSFAIRRALISAGEGPTIGLNGEHSEELFARFWSHGVSWGVIPTNASERDARRIFQVFSANAQALFDYRPGAYNGELLLLLAQNQAGAARHSPQREWARSCSHLTVRQLPGDHFSLLKPPRVKALADALWACLSAAGPTLIANETSAMAAGPIPPEITDDCLTNGAPALL
jgi:amino acid adenylation domain-containing protein